jgi:hypothetical protein
VLTWKLIVTLRGVATLHLNLIGQLEVSHFYSSTGACNMAKEIKIKVFADPGHAWARFPKQRLVKLGIADKISAYSYQRGSVLISALKFQGYDIKFDENHANKSSKIRSYNSYHA